MATIKQKQAFEKVVKGSSLTNAMKEVGYSESTAKRTNKLTNTDGWQELLQKHIPDNKLSKVLDEGLEAGKKVFKNNNATKQVEEVGYEPDYAVRHKYLETALELKGKYPKEDAPTMQINLIQIIERVNQVLDGNK